MISSIPTDHGVYAPKEELCYGMYIASNCLIRVNIYLDSDWILMFNVSFFIYLDWGFSESLAEIIQHGRLCISNVRFSENKNSNLSNEYVLKQNRT